MKRTAALLLSMALWAAPLSPASAQVIRAAGTTTRAIALPALPLGSMLPGAGLAGLSLTAPTPGASALPLPLLPALKAPRLSPSFALTPSFASSQRGPAAAVPQALLRKVARVEPLRAAVKEDSSPGRRSAALGNVFDGGGSLSADAVPSGLSGVAADTFQNGFGFYRWISDLPEIAGSRPELAKARVLLAAAPLLEQGPVIAMKDGASLTILSVKDPGTPPAVVSLSRSDLAPESATPRELMLADRLERAVARDAADHTFVNVAELMNKLPDIAREEPAP
ncbi:hypothetical protein ACFL2T_06750, partial [Elusimicrobiota bacterium]